LTSTQQILNFTFTCSQIKELKSTVWYDNKISPLASISKIVKSLTQNRTETPTVFMHRQRLIKSKAEINLMQRTCDIASTAINKVMQDSKPGISEHHIFAMVDYNCRIQNADYLAYPPVVAAGNNATTIHYINNTQVVNDGDMVLMDAGKKR
jgi:Xaa-Pro aminopeptidase